MNIGSLEWDDENVEHIGRHSGISPKDVEDVCFGLHIVYRGKYGRYILYGQTDDGIYLNVVLERLHGSRFRPVTARPMSKGEKHNYKKKLK